MKYDRITARILSIALTAGLLFFGLAYSKEPVDYVDPFIGTDFYAHTFPGPALPFAMVQLSPDVYNVGWDYSSGYYYKTTSIMGFSHTHLSGAGAAIMGDILIMPTIGYEIQTIPGPRDDPDAGYRSRFDHADETASPGYYTVHLKDYNIKVELTATPRVGFHRYTFPKADNAHILVDLGHVIGELPEEKSHLKVLSNTQIEGFKFGQGAIIYFVAEFSKPFAAFGTWDNLYQKPESEEKLNPYKTAESGESIGLFINYRTSAEEVVLVKVGLSFVSIEGARKNLQSEIPDWDFDRVRMEARNVWNRKLQKITIKGGTEDQKQIFYTALYHALVAQYISNDVDGRYFGIDGKVHTAEKYDFFPSFLAWDTFRTEHPLMTLIEPGHVNDMLKSIQSKCKNYGWLPAQHIRNNFGQGMVGDHLVPIIVDAYRKGFRDFDADLLYNFMRKKAMGLPPESLDSTNGRYGLKYYKSLGYLPADKTTESVPNTMELAYDDWCIAQMARDLGKEDENQLFMKRAGYYKNVFDPGTRFMRPRKLDGSWLELCEQPPEIITDGEHSYYSCFDPLWVGVRPNRHFTESNAWQYLWSVPHDVTGLINLLGGRERFIGKLDTCFTMSAEITGPNYVGVVGTIGQYVHGNQPSHHVAYLYDYAGAPWKTQERVRQIMDMLYRTGPGGICGNDDMGSLSSWYVFSAIGFYPVCPGSNIYVIGSPLFEEVVINLDHPYPAGKFIVKAHNVSLENKYIQSAILDGRPLNRPWITHSDIVNGGALIFEMGAEPNKQWGSAPAAAPPSISR